eukprot:jgi/Mesvir1/25496/Mv01754-RA.1
MASAKQPTAVPRSWDECMASIMTPPVAAQPAPPAPNSASIPSKDGTARVVPTPPPPPKLQTIVPASGPLTLEDYTTLFHVLTRGSGTNTCNIQPDDDAAKAVDINRLKQVLQLHGFSLGSKRSIPKGELLSKMHGMQLWNPSGMSETTPAFDGPGTTEDAPGLAVPGNVFYDASEFFQDMATVGWCGAQELTPAQLVNYGRYCNHLPDDNVDDVDPPAVTGDATPPPVMNNRERSEPAVGDRDSRPPFIAGKSEAPSAVMGHRDVPNVIKYGTRPPVIDAGTRPPVMAPATPVSPWKRPRVQPPTDVSVVPVRAVAAGAATGPSSMPGGESLYEHKLPSPIYSQPRSPSPYTSGQTDEGESDGGNSARTMACEPPAPAEAGEAEYGGAWRTVARRSKGVNDPEPLLRSIRALMGDPIPQQANASSNMSHIRDSHLMAKSRLLHAAPSDNDPSLDDTARPRGSMGVALPGTIPHRPRTRAALAPWPGPTAGDGAGGPEGWHARASLVGYRIVGVLMEDFELEGAVDGSMEERPGADDSMRERGVAGGGPAGGGTAGRWGRPRIMPRGAYVGDVLSALFADDQGPSSRNNNSNAQAGAATSGSGAPAPHLVRFRVPGGSLAIEIEMDLQRSHMLTSWDELLQTVRTGPTSRLESGFLLLPPLKHEGGRS